MQTSSQEISKMNISSAIVVFLSTLVIRYSVALRSVIIEKSNVSSMGGVTCMSKIEVKSLSVLKYDLQKNPFDTCVVNTDISLTLYN